MPADISHIEAAVIDGRARSPRFIQKQLRALHDALIRSLTDIQIVGDQGSNEAWTEIAITLKAVKNDYASVNLTHILEQEYSLALGKDNIHRRPGYGCAFIIPAGHTPLYSIVQPISAAITVGNCVVLEITQSASRVAKLVAQILTTSLDRDTFIVVDKLPPIPITLSGQTVIVDSGGENRQETYAGSSLWVKSPSSDAIAIVDRSAAITDAAKALVRSRFCFGGTSPYAPVLVLVNEFVLGEFCQAATQSLTTMINPSKSYKGPQQKLALDQTFEKAMEKNEASLLVNTNVGSIVLLRKRQFQPALVIHATKSLDDAIDVANSISDEPLLASFIFAAPRASKYLSQFVISDCSFTNHIPAQLLVGPAAPTSHPILVDTRLPSLFFSRPSPEFLTQSLIDRDSARLLDTNAPVVLEKLKAEARSPLPKSDEPDNRGIGFFEQGILTDIARKSDM
ncbi:hypothetical protein K461DRAFT_265028 [Myriangium duriaei CBS 260.36]|uniref:Aldehyde dehydrogenase domain-containing protein n=1 Tax=Myriangium duriaei CBS 260.36 TaxID=1168546 RepID=A0A9P4JAX9_9PEZI|nr:hypothetical protein K461DRAFT_265028 [Myriangium duriaei CBS 260.36]